MANIVELPEIPVMRTTSPNDVEGVSDTISLVEEKLGHNLRGRKCYGISNPSSSGIQYKACVAIQEGDDPKVFLQ